MNVRLMFATVLIVNVLSSAAAFACSPVLQGSVQSSPFANPEHIAFILRGDVGPAENQEFVVKEKGTLALVPGTKAVLENSDVVVFTPDSPLILGGEYLIEFSEQLGNVGLDVISVEIIEESPSATLNPARGQFYQAEVEQVCCSTETGACSDSCGGCMICWPGEYEYRPAILSEVIASRVPVVIDTYVYEQGDETNEDFYQSRIGFETLTLENRLSNETNTGVCVRTLIRDLENNVLLESRDCVAIEDFPAVEREMPDFPERVAQCAEEPDNTADPNWQRYSSTSKVGGCSTTGSSQAGLPLLFLLAGFGLRLGRRRRVS